MEKNNYLVVKFFTHSADQITACFDHYIHTCRPSVHFSKSCETKLMTRENIKIAIGEIVGVPEGIIDFLSYLKKNFEIWDFMTQCLTISRFSVWILIHSANAQSRPVGIIVFAHFVRPLVRLYVRPSPFLRSSKTKQQ